MIRGPETRTPRVEFVPQRVGISLDPSGSPSARAAEAPHKKPKMAAAGPMFWWMVNSLPIGEQRLLNHRSLPGQASMPG